ncbi:hypothetical protein C8J30_1134 [Rhodobacter viridis]|uniref:Uncharacterized protein n=1 Tax=Rhodobacter viridis TaxID=1054202 RepID=A0A318TWK9_9RHOB|nr:hypothetical protein C8J30_1134 [Rhodobacter viridis]
MDTTWQQIEPASRLCQPTFNSRRVPEELQPDKKCSLEHRADRHRRLAAFQRTHSFSSATQPIGKILFAPTQELTASLNLVGEKLQAVSGCKGVGTRVGHRRGRAMLIFGAIMAENL